MFLSSFRADAGTDRSVFGNFWFEPVGLRTAGGMVRVTPASAMGLSPVYACVKVLAESFAIMPFVLNRPKVNGGSEKVRNHWLYRLIAKAPNAFQTPYEWRLMLMGHLALRGNAFCQITANGAGEIIELLPLHPDRMAIVPLSNGSYRYDYTDQSGTRIPYARQDIWHLRGLSDDGYMGMSPIALAREAIGEGLAIQSYSTRFFANDAKPGGGWIEYPGNFATNEAKKKFRDSWQENQGGANRGKVAVLERGMKFHELGMSNKDAEFIEARKAKVEEIARIFRVPPHMIGELTRSTNNNIEHQGIEFWNNTMLPWENLWESSISYFLLGPDDELEPEFDHKDMIRGDGQARAERIARLVLAGVMTRNEGRQEEGYDPVDGLDEPLQPVNMMSLEQAEQQQGVPPGQKPQPAGPSDDAGAADEAADRMATRMQVLLRGNAARLARRAAKEGTLAAAVVSEAMAVPDEEARAWCAVNRAGVAEEDIAASLVQMAGGFQGALPAPAPVINITAPVTVNNAPPAVKVDAPITNNLPAAQVSVDAPVVNVVTPEPNVSVSVAAPTVNVTTPEPVVHVAVDAPVVNVTNEAAQAPNVSINVEAPKQADKPWPTRTTIKKRDEQGRADVIETTPIDK